MRGGVPESGLLHWTQGADASSPLRREIISVDAMKTSY